MSLYEQMMELALKLEAEADEISPPDEDADEPWRCTYGCEDKTFDDVDDFIAHAWEKHGVRDYHVERDLDDDSQALEAETLRQTAQRIKDILNVSEEADTGGSASSQHFVDTGVRLPRDPDGVIRAAALAFLHSVDPAGLDLGKLADALDVPREDVEALK